MVDTLRTALQLPTQVRGDVATSTSTLGSLRLQVQTSKLQKLNFITILQIRIINDSMRNVYMNLTFWYYS